MALHILCKTDSFDDDEAVIGEITVSQNGQPMHLESTAERHIYIPEYIIIQANLSIPRMSMLILSDPCGYLRRSEIPTYTPPCNKHPVSFSNVSQLVCARSSLSNDSQTQNQTLIVK